MKTEQYIIDFLTSRASKLVIRLERLKIKETQNREKIKGLEGHIEFCVDVIEKLEELKAYKEDKL